MKLKILMILLTLQIALTGCTSLTYPTPTKTKYSFVDTEVPNELLRCEELPDPKELKGISFLKGADKAKKYCKQLVLVNYKNCLKIKSIKKLLR